MRQSSSSWFRQSEHGSAVVNVSRLPSLLEPFLHVFVGPLYLEPNAHGLTLGATLA